jgi:hypothetical protein
MAAKSTKQTTVVAFRIDPDERQNFDRLACAIRRATGKNTTISDVIRRAISAGIHCVEVPQ